MNEWNEFVAKQRENDLASIIQAERQTTGNERIHGKLIP